MAHAVDRLKLSFLALGILLFCALIITVLHIGEIEQFIQLAEQVNFLWLILALLCQTGTYFSEAAAWQMALRELNLPTRLRELVPLSIAKLFSDQAMPSGGLSGTVFFLSALKRRGIESEQALICLVLNLVAHFVAYLAAALINLLLLAWDQLLNRWVITISVPFTLMTIFIPITLLHARWKSLRMNRIMARHLGKLNESFQTLQKVSDKLPRRPSLMAKQAVLHFAIILLDSLTLFAALKGIGQDIEFATAFCGFVTASMVATLSPIPLGLGTFEATCVAMLHLLGVDIEAGLTATILLRGLTVWLPMLPGLWLIRSGLRENLAPRNR